MAEAKSAEKTRKPHAAGRKDDGTGERERTVADFKEAVNMSASELSKWLDTPESREVGFKGASGDGKESVGHRSGRRIVRLLGKSTDQLTAGDIAHMRKVAGYVGRHLAQRPEGDISETPWRYSLMNWGHDPKHGSKKKH